LLVESKLASWITAGLALYKAHPLMIESIFYDASQSGAPTFLGDGFLDDVEKLWLPDEYIGGTLRWGNTTFPILGNTPQQLTVDGNPSLVNPGDFPFYQIVPPSVAGLTELLTQEKFTVLTAFAQVPTQMPAFTIRLERDSQGDTYIGESLKQYVIDGVEFDVRSQALTGSYLISVWTINRDLTLWLYAWLQSWALNSLPMFSTWGLYDVAFAGSDLDPATQYLAERTYPRHMLLTASRLEHAVITREPIEWVSGLCIKVCAQYALLQQTIYPVME
jgi:hypothetical protein